MFYLCKRKVKQAKLPIIHLMTVMKDRIKQIMESQKMTQQEFADYIGLAPATLSSIFNGRTRPTLNVVEALKKKIPNINIEWLMFGSGEMTSTPQIELSESGQTGIAPQNPTSPMFDFDPSPSPTPQNNSSMITNPNSVRTTRPEMVVNEVKMQDKPQRRVLEIRVFYDDQTWETFVPAKK